MPNITYKSLFELVQNQIDKSIKFQDTPTFRNQLSRSDPVAPLVSTNASEIRVSQVIQAIQDLLEQAIPDSILEGLEVTENDPVDNTVIVTAGKGSSGGILYTLNDDFVLPVPFDSSTEVYFINLYRDRLTVDKTTGENRLTLAKVVVPKPGTTSQVRNDKSTDSYDAYIISYKEVKFHGNSNGILEEDSIEILRENIGVVLADNLIGNIRLSENLKITNTQGSLSVDSQGLNLYDINSNQLAKFNKNGIFFYNSSGVELSRFTTTDAKIGNIKITKNSLESNNFVSGSTGFQIKDDGNVEFNNLVVRGTVYATAGLIGGWTIASDSLYATTTGTIKTGADVQEGQDGVVIDKDGVRGYSSLLGTVFNLPSDGSAPTFSSGIINSTIWNINTNSVMRTSETVGDGTSASYGILINDTGFYGLGANQTPSTANLRVLSNGNIYMRGEIQATSGVIGGFTISSDRLVGGTIEGTTIIGGIFETSTTTPRIRIDVNGLYYQATASTGKYGSFKYGSSTKYGTGNTAALFNSNYPVLSILQEQTKADIRLYNRGSDPASGSHQLGDIIVVNSIFKICKTAGSPGTFRAALTYNGSTGFQSGATLGNYISVDVNGSTYKIPYI